MTLYEEHAAAYAQHTARSTWNALYERPAIQRAIGKVNGRTVLDAGCASGELTAWLLSQGAEVTALDKSSAFLAMVGERFGPDVHLCETDLSQALPLQEASYELIVSSLTLHYVRDWSALMRELFRITKPGGRLVFSTHHPAMTSPLVSDYFSISLVKDAFVLDGVAYPVQYYHRPLQDIAGTVLAAGYTVQAICEPLRNEKPEQPWFLILDCVKPRLQVCGGG